jgi:hypothetical protein
LLWIKLKQLCFALLLSLSCGSTMSHLMSAGNGSLNILTDKAVLLVGVPVNFFQNIDINQDGLLQPDEIKSKRSQIISQLSHGLQVKIGGSTGEVIDDQIIVSVHVDAQNSTPQIEWLRQLQFPSQNVDQPLRIELSTELLASNYLFKVKRSDLQEFAIF